MAKSYNDVPIIKDRVKEVLKEQGKTQLQLALYLGIDKDSLNQCLRKGYTNETNLVNIGEFLDVHPYYFSSSDVPRLSFSVYETYTATPNKGDTDYCVRELIRMMGYAPGDYTKDELSELKVIIGRVVDKYSIIHDKESADIAFWIGDASDPSELSTWVPITPLTRVDDASDPAPKKSVTITKRSAQEIDEIMKKRLDEGSITEYHYKKYLEEKEKKSK